MQVLKRLRSRRAKVGSGAALATLALVGSGLAVSSAPAASVEAPAPAPVMKQAVATAKHKKQMRCRVPRCFGAITLAFGNTVAGLSNDAPTRKKAWKKAARDCRRQTNFPCRRIVWVRNGCAALAVKTKGRRVHKYAAVTKYRNPRPAVRAAKRKCKRVRPVGRPCLKTAYVCTKRRY